MKLTKERMSKLYEEYAHHIVRAHIITIFNLLISLFFADAMFLYCSSFIAPLIILSFTIVLSKKRKNYKFYPVALIGCIYVLVVGALMYSGVFARNIYSLGQNLLVTYPTNADLSILIITLIVWYYSTFIDKYTPKSSVENYTNEQDEAFNKFDEATK